MDSESGISVNPDDLTQGPDLSRVPGFGAEDVAENLAGRLSDTQVVAVRNRAIGIAVGVALLLAFTGFFWMSAGLSLVLAIPGVCLAVFAYRLARIATELQNPTVALVEGVIRTEENEGDCTLHIHQYKLSLSTRAHQSLPDGGPYRVFFLERANMVVGVQVLPGWSATASPASRHFRNQPDDRYEI